MFPGYVSVSTEPMFRAPDDPPTFTSVMFTHSTGTFQHNKVTILFLHLQTGWRRWFMLIFSSLGVVLSWWFGSICLMRAPRPWWWTRDKRSDRYDVQRMFLFLQIFTGISHFQMEQFWCFRVLCVFCSSIGPKLINKKWRIALWD